MYFIRKKRDNGQVFNHRYNRVGTMERKENHDYNYLHKK